VIAFGASMTSPELYARVAEGGVRRAAEADSAVFAYQAAGSIFRSYNLILDHAAALPDLEALVLVHQDTEILDPGFCAQVREVLRDPEVGVAGAAGAVGVRSVAWWEGRLSAPAAAVQRYGESGGGEIPLAAWATEGTAPPGEVETLEGFLLVLSPWAVRELRFDEALGDLHGYDFDLCAQVRRAGRKVVVAPFRVAHHHSLDLVTDNEPWVAAHERVAEKWDPGPGTEEGWRQRARRAEAEAGAARLLNASREYQGDALSSELEARLEAIVASPSWRASAPLRRLNRLRRGRRTHPPDGPVQA
jgi:hypothetical protein